MKRFLALFLCIFSLIFSSCEDISVTPDNNEILLTGHFLRISEDLCILILDEETRSRFPNDVYMKLLTDHPFSEDGKQVSLDDFSDGDLIGVYCMTIADLSPRVIDVLGVKLIEKGSISDINFDVFSFIEVDINTSDIDRVVLNAFARLNGITPES